VKPRRQVPWGCLMLAVVAVAVVLLAVASRLLMPLLGS
jgi:hypothetical protein